MITLRPGEQPADPFYNIPNADGRDDYRPGQPADDEDQPLFIGGATLREDRIRERNED